MWERERREDLIGAGLLAGLAALLSIVAIIAANI